MRVAPVGPKCRPGGGRSERRNRRTKHISGPLHGRRGAGHTHYTPLSLNSPGGSRPQFLIWPPCPTRAAPGRSIMAVSASSTLAGAPPGLPGLKERREGQTCWKAKIVYGMRRVAERVFSTPRCIFGKRVVSLKRENTSGRYGLGWHCTAGGESMARGPEGCVPHTARAVPPRGRGWTDVRRDWDAELRAPPGPPGRRGFENTHQQVR